MRKNTPHLVLVVESRKKHFCLFHQIQTTILIGSINLTFLLNKMHAGSKECFFKQKCKKKKKSWVE